MNSAELFDKALGKFIAENCEKTGDHSYTTGYFSSVMCSMFKQLPKKKQQYFLELMLFAKI